VHNLGNTKSNWINFYRSAPETWIWSGRYGLCAAGWGGTCPTFPNYQ